MTEMAEMTEFADEWEIEAPFYVQHLGIDPEKARTYHSKKYLEIFLNYFSDCKRSKRS